MTGLSVGGSLFSTQPVLATDNDSIVFFTVENLCTSQWNVLHSDFTCNSVSLLSQIHSSVALFGEIDRN